MAIIPNRADPSQMLAGVVGAWANMEEDNARSGFAESEFAAGVPLMVGAGEQGVLPLTTGNRFIGIAIRNNDMGGTPTTDGDTTYQVGDLLGVADMGVLFVLAGAGVNQKAPVFYEPATRKYHGATAAGRLPLPTVEFDTAAAEGQPVGLRIRVLPGAANVTAAA